MFGISGEKENTEKENKLLASAVASILGEVAKPRLKFFSVVKKEDERSKSTQRYIFRVKVRKNK